MLLLLAFALLLAGGDCGGDLKQGIAAFERKEYVTAQARFEGCTRAEPGNGRVWMMLAQTYGRRKNVAEAAVAALKADAAGTSDPVVLQGLAFLYSEIVPDVGRAAAYQQRYAEVADGDRGAWTAAAQLWSAAGKFAEAQAAAEKALARNPYEEQSHFLLAQAHLARLDFAGAVKVLEDGRRTFDKSVQLELAYGVALYGQRRFSEAVTAFLRTMDLDSDVPQPYSFLGKMLEHSEDRLPELVKRFAEYEARHPESPLGYLLHGKALAAQLPPAGFPPEAEEAQKLIAKSLELDEKSAEAHYELGCLLERRRAFAGAATHLERSAALNGKLAETHYHLARVYDRMGRGEEAAAERALHEKLNAKTRDAASDVRLR